MALSEAKTLDSERNLIYVKSNEGSRLTETVTENKNVFDKFPQLNMDKHNRLVDLLIALGLDTIKTDLADRYTEAETEARLSEETNDLVETIKYTKSDGKFKITTKGGEVTTIDTDLEKIPADFSLINDGDTVYLRITNQDGTYTQTDVTELLNIYIFEHSDTITFSETFNAAGHNISAYLRQASVLREHLSSEVTSYLEGLTSEAKAYVNYAQGYASNAERSANSAEVSANDALSEATSAALNCSQAERHSISAKSYAVGGTGTRTGEDTDNAQYYKNRASGYADSAFSFYSGAELAARNAASAFAGAKEARTAAENAQSSAEEAANGAITARDDAVDARDVAITAKEAAQASAKEAAETVESKAPLASPTFTGTPTAPTPDTDDNSTRIATTAFVDGVKKAVLGGLIFSITAEGLVHVEQEV